MAEGIGAAAGGGRWVDVAPDRLARWVASFAERHGAITAEPGRRAHIEHAVANCIAFGSKNSAIVLRRAGS